MSQFQHHIQTALSFWKAFPIGQTLKQILNISVLQILCGTLCGHATPRLEAGLQPDIFYDRSQVPGRAQRVEDQNYGDVFLASELQNVDFWTTEMTLREEDKLSSLPALWTKADRACQNRGERGIAIRLKRRPKKLPVFEVLCGKEREQNVLRNGQHFTLLRGLNIEVPLGHDPGKIALDWCQQQHPAVVPHAVHAARFSLQIQSSSVGSSSLFSIACLAPRSLADIPQDVLRESMKFLGPGNPDYPDFTEFSQTSPMMYEASQTVARQYAYDDPEGRSPCHILSLRVTVDSLLARISQPQSDRYRAFEVREGQFSKNTWNQFIQSDLFRREITELRLSRNSMAQILQSADDYVQLIDHVLDQTQIHSFNLGSVIRIIRLEADKKIRILVDYSRLPESLPYLEDLRFEKIRSESAGEYFVRTSMHLSLKENVDISRIIKHLKQQRLDLRELKSLSLEVRKRLCYEDFRKIANVLGRLPLQGLRSFSMEAHAVDQDEDKRFGFLQIARQLQSLPNLNSVRFQGEPIELPLQTWIDLETQRLGEDVQQQRENLLQQREERQRQRNLEEGQLEQQLIKQRIKALIWNGLPVAAGMYFFDPFNIRSKFTGPISLDYGHLLGEEGGNILLKDLRKRDHSGLKFLDFTGSKLGNSGMSKLVEGFSGIPKLRVLYLRNNQIGDLGATLLAPGFSLLPNLAYLDLSQNQIEAQGGIALAEGLAKAKGLLYLNLQGNRIGLEGIEAFSSTFEQFENLVSLDFSENNLQDLEIESLAKGLPHLSNLSSLILKGNAFGWAGLRALLSGIKDLKNLTLLNISGNKLEEELGLDQDPAEKSAYFEKMLAPLRQLRPDLKVIY